MNKNMSTNKMRLNWWADGLLVYVFVSFFLLACDVILIIASSVVYLSYATQPYYIHAYTCGVMHAYVCVHFAIMYDV